MNPERAKEVLLLYRPGTDDEADPECLEALEFIRQDPELEQWFEQRQAVSEALRLRFRQIPVPAGLQEQILSERPAHIEIRRLRRPAMLAVALAALALLVGLSVVWLRPNPQDTFTIYRERMMSFAVRGSYTMDLDSSSLAQIQSYLAGHRAPADYVLPVALTGSNAVGCALVTWQGSKVSMICYRTGKPLEPGTPSDLWLFVVDRKALKDAPQRGPPELVRFRDRWITASWANGNKVYLLGVEGDQSTIRKYL